MPTFAHTSCMLTANVKTTPYINEVDREESCQHFRTLVQQHLQVMLRIKEPNGDVTARDVTLLVRREMMLNGLDGCNRVGRVTCEMHFSNMNVFVG